MTSLKEIAILRCDRNKVSSSDCLIIFSSFLWNKNRKITASIERRKMAQSPTSGAVKALQLELKKMMGEPVEGFQVKLMDDDNLFEWEVAIFGPPGTMYEGGYFKVRSDGFTNIFSIDL